MTTATDEARVDWDAAPMTDAARNTKTPDRRVRVVCVPRAAFKKHMHTTWKELQAACASGEDGLTPLLVMGVDRPDSKTAFMREGLASERSLQGLALLFMQGW